MASLPRFDYLFQQYLRKQYTAPEREEFFQLLQEPEHQRQLEQLSVLHEVPAGQSPLVNEASASQILDAILRTGESPAARIIPFYQRSWVGYAAAILIVLGMGAYLWNTQTSTKKTTPSPVQHTSVKNDVLPGGNKATLTLANGQTIILDSAVNGTLAEQAGARVIKRQDGQLDYQMSRDQKNQEIVAYNTMRTPRGGQYQIRLPDGTKVWLNAASSITYPTKFIERERKVTIEGEAYFEVTKNARQPFIVDVKGMSLQVLGTSFNVNSYGDDQLIVKTTLLEGLVLVKSGIAIEKLQPGQQAQVSVAGGLEVKKAVNMEAVMAWKNGYFNFDQQSLETSLRQLARWYDVTVSFAGKRPSVQLGGKIQRNLTLSNLLDGFEMMGLHAELRPDKQLLIHE